jgi:hypothetical protein
VRRNRWLGPQQGLTLRGYIRNRPADQLIGLGLSTILVLWFNSTRPIGSVKMLIEDPLEYERKEI